MNGLDQLAAKILQTHIRYATEAEMQQDVELLLARDGFEFKREFKLSSRDRVDFLVTHESRNVALECKISGSPVSVMSQLARYAESSKIDGVLLVSSRRVLLASEAFREQEILGKPLRGVWVGGFR